MKLNLGSGENYKEGWVNLDYNRSYKADFHHNLNVFPYPFQNGTFDLILMEHVLEHLENPVKCLEELCRISKLKGIIIISMPHFSHFMAWADLTHKRVASIFSFQNYEDGRPEYYSKLTNFRVIEKKFTATRTKSLWINRVLNPILNFSYLFTELFLCKIIPVSQVIFKLEVVKNERTI